MACPCWDKPVAQVIAASATIRRLLSRSNRGPCGFDGAATDVLNPIRTAWDDNRFIAAGVAYWQTDAGWCGVDAAEFDR